MDRTRALTMIATVLLLIPVLAIVGLYAGTIATVRIRRETKRPELDYDDTGRTAEQACADAARPLVTYFVLLDENGNEQQR